MSKSKDNITLVAEIDSMSSRALEKFAEKKSAEILEKIQDAFEEIEAYKTSEDEKAEIDGVGQHFKNLFTGGDYKRDKSISAIQNTISKMKVDSATAMLKILTIVEESIMFTCSSTKLASNMTSSMAAMMAKGFVDSNGNLRELDENTREFASFILGQADMFVQNQQEYEDRMFSVENIIQNLRDINSDQDLRIDKALDATEKNKKNIQRLSEESQKRDVMIKEQKEKSEKKESEQDKAIQRQVEKDVEQDLRLDAGEKKDKAQDQEIIRQAKKDKEHDDKLEKGELKDSEQDLELARQAKKDEEHDKILAAHSQKDEEHDKEIENGRVKDAEQDEEIEKQVFKNKAQDVLIDELKELLIKQGEAINEILENNKKYDRYFDDNLDEINGIKEKDDKQDKLFDEISEQIKELDQILQNNKKSIEMNSSQIDNALSSIDDVNSKMNSNFSEVNSVLDGLKSNYFTKSMGLLTFIIAFIALIISILHFFI